MTEERVTLAKRIKETREYLGFTQQQVAEALSLRRSGISDIETGKRRVTADELKRIANLFQHPVSHFLGEEPEHAPDVAALARTAENLSKHDRKELLRFAKFLEYQTKRDSSKKGA
ncbi:MAG: helix-turn-helix transcriptional regulator [Deltaproteobacteria bacterium]|nr:helix-turn-helix transcriptional regulator [Deltaproteobacteria bacterium]